MSCRDNTLNIHQRKPTESWLTVCQKLQMNFPVKNQQDEGKQQFWEHHHSNTLLTHQHFRKAEATPFFSLAGEIPILLQPRNMGLGSLTTEGQGDPQSPQ